jgi:16S rRNA (uracil1498-N3)-methyltransferase
MSSQSKCVQSSEQPRSSRGRPSAPSHGGVVRSRRRAVRAGQRLLAKTIPTITDVVSTTQLVNVVKNRTVIVLDPRAPQTLGEWARTHTTETDIAVVVGPEGGISHAEMESLLAAGAVGVRIGDNVLRTSTAGAASFAGLRAIFGQY